MLLSCLLIFGLELLVSFCEKYVKSAFRFLKINIQIESTIYKNVGAFLREEQYNNSLLIHSSDKREQRRNCSDTDVILPVFSKFFLLCPPLITLLLCFPPEIAQNAR